MKESRSGRLAISKDKLGTSSIWIGDSLLQSFLGPYEGKHVTVTVEVEE